MIEKGKMSKNYVIKPEVQNSPEFRQYIRNLHLMVEHCMGDLYKIKHELRFASKEMKTMPKDGLCDIKKMSKNLLDKSYDVVDLSKDLSDLKRCFEAWDDVSKKSPHVDWHKKETA